jgi:hypothetical protein
MTGAQTLTTGLICAATVLVLAFDAARIAAGL